jgi:DNA-directed RNA polymerase specialized sigma24 family protein
MVRAALTHLSALRRAVIDTYMKHGETLSQAQMANIVGISVDAFESRFRRAKASLRKIIEENYKKLVER